MKIFSLLLAAFIATAPVLQDFARGVQNLGLKIEQTTPEEVKTAAQQATKATIKGIKSISSFLWTAGKQAARSIKLESELKNARAQRDLAIVNRHLYTPEQLQAFEDAVKLAEQKFLALV